MAPTIKPKADFNVDVEVDRLYNALKNGDEEALIRIITLLENAQRQLLLEPFKANYGQDLREELKKKLHGNFERLMLALMQTPAAFDAQELHRAISGLGTKENTLVEILMTRGQEELEAIMREYQAAFGKSLEEDIVRDTSGDLRRIFVSLLANSRNADARVNEKAAIEDATMLFNAGWNKLFNDSAEFHAMLFTQSTAQLSRIFVEFQKLSGMSIEEFQRLAAMETELVPGNALDGYLAVLTAMQYRTRFFANQLHNAVKGLGTRDGDLIRIVVSRSEIDLQEISEAYEKDHKKTLREALEGDTSGAYRECLLAIVNGN